MKTERKKENTECNINPIPNPVILFHFLVLHSFIG